MSSKSARRRRRQAAWKRRERQARHAPPAAAPSAVVPLRPGPARDPYAVSKARALLTSTGVSAASVLIALPTAGQMIRHSHAQPRYAATVAGAASSLGRWDEFHRDGLEWAMNREGPQPGTTRTMIATGPLDPWADQVARERYGPWGPDLFGD